MSDDQGSPRQSTWGRAWAKSLTAKIGEDVKVRVEARQPRLTVTDLAARCGIARPVMSNLLNGERESISVAELLALAAALGTSPVDLLLPQNEATVEILPGRRVPVDEAARWIVHGGRLAGVDVYANEHEARRPGFLLQHATRVDTAQDLFAVLNRELQHNLFALPGDVHDPRRIAGRIRLLKDTIDALQFDRDLMRERKQTPPDLPLSLLDLDRQSGPEILKAQVDYLDTLIRAAADPDTASPELRIELQRLRDEWATAQLVVPGVSGG